MHTESGILDPIYNQIVNQLIQQTKSLNATKFVCSSKANLTTCVGCNTVKLQNIFLNINQNCIYK